LAWQKKHAEGITMTTPVLKRRSSEKTANELHSLAPLLARIYANRGIHSLNDIQRELSSLHSPTKMKSSDRAAELIFNAIERQLCICIVGDFDADGATSTAVAVLGLRALGAQNVQFLVPNRFQFGYGLTPPIVDLALAQGAQCIITVDNGIASIDGVKHAKQNGLQVLITDHHLPGEVLPNADVIVNPNLPDCDFPSKNLAGVGVLFYVLMAARALLREKKHPGKEANLAQLLDLVALGTVADVVPLDSNNRVLVYQGLQRIRAGQCRPGIKAMLTLAKRDLRSLTATDLAFAVAPRLNAAGRLDDMSRGIQCLLEENSQQAMQLAQELERLNIERKQIEEAMLSDADEIVANYVAHEGDMRFGLCLFDEQWHQGVIGLIAGRVKEKFHRPTICFAPGKGDEVKGSARSITGVHIRDVLADIANQHPDLLSKFGGHAMAAGLTIHHAELDRFSALFDATVNAHLNGQALEAEVWSDGELNGDEFNLDNAYLLRNAGPWGQHFPEPLFDGHFDVVQQRTVGEKHIKLKLRHSEGAIIDAIAFDAERKGWQQQTRVHCAFKLDVNEYNGNTTLQLMIERFF
jgi:single-stranded-DNA-specific exonuclease